MVLTLRTALAPQCMVKGEGLSCANSEAKCGLENPHGRIRRPGASRRIFLFLGVEIKYISISPSSPLSVCRSSNIFPSFLFDFMQLQTKDNSEAEAMTKVALKILIVIACRVRGEFYDNTQ